MQVVRTGAKILQRRHRAIDKPRRTDAHEIRGPVAFLGRQCGQFGFGLVETHHLFTPDQQANTGFIVRPPGGRLTFAQPEEMSVNLAKAQREELRARSGGIAGELRLGAERHADIHDIQDILPAVFEVGAPRTGEHEHDGGRNGGEQMAERWQAHDGFLSSGGCLKQNGKTIIA